MYANILALNLIWLLHVEELWEYKMKLYVSNRVGST